MPDCVVHNGIGLASIFRELFCSGRICHGKLKASNQRHRGRGARADRSGLGGNRASHHRHAARFHGARRLRRNAGQRRFAACARGEADCGGAGRGARQRHAGRAHPRGTFARPVRRAAGKGRARRAKPANRRSRPDGTHPDPRRSRPRHHSCTLSARQRDRDRQTRQRRVLRHRARRCAAEIRHRKSAGVRRDHRSLRQHHGARGQRPRLSLRRAGRWLRFLFS